MNYKTERLLATALILLLLKSNLVSAKASESRSSEQTKSTELEKRYYYGAQQPQQYGYQPQYQNGYYYNNNPYYYQQQQRPMAMQQQPQYQQPQYQQPQYNNMQRTPNQRNRKVSACNSDSGTNVMNLLGKVSNTKTHVDHLTNRLQVLLSDMVHRPLQGVMEIPQTVYEGFTMAINVGQDLRGSVHLVQCAGPQVRKTLVQSVKALEGSRLSLMSVSNQGGSSGPFAGLRNLISEVENLVSSAIKDIVTMVATQHIGGSGSGDSGSSSNSNPYAAYTDDGSDDSSSTSASGSDASATGGNPFAGFSDFADPTLTSAAAATSTSAKQAPAATPAQCGPSVFTTTDTFKFTLTQSPSSSHGTPKVYTFTTKKTYTFSNLVKRSVETSPVGPVMFDGIDSGDGDPNDNGGPYGDTSNTGKYSYVGGGWNNGPDYGGPLDTAGSQSFDAVPTISQKPLKTSTSTSMFFAGTGAVFPHHSLSFIQHDTEEETTSTPVQESTIQTAHAHASATTHTSHMTLGHHL